MKTKTTHTPTPWTMRESENGNTYEIVGNPGFVLSIGKAKAGHIDAAYIVRAVNAHEDLLKALKAVMANAKWLGDKYEITEREIGIMSQAIASTELQ